MKLVLLNSLSIAENRVFETLANGKGQPDDVSEIAKIAKICNLSDLQVHVVLQSVIIL